jgi:hypothetical protein
VPPPPGRKEKLLGKVSFRSSGPFPSFLLFCGIRTSLLFRLARSGASGCLTFRAAGCILYEFGLIGEQKLNDGHDSIDRGKLRPCQ